MRYVLQRFLVNTPSYRVDNKNKEPLIRLENNTKLWVNTAKVDISDAFFLASLKKKKGVLLHHKYYVLGITYYTIV